MIKNNIPNLLMTLANLFLGCNGVIFCIYPAVFNRVLLFLAAGLCDMFDGMVARILQVHSTGQRIGFISLM